MQCSCVHWCSYLGGRGQGFSRLSPEPMNRFGLTLILFKLCPLCEVLGKFDRGPATGVILDKGNRVYFFCPSVTHQFEYFQHCYTSAFAVKKSGSALGRIVSWQNLICRPLRGLKFRKTWKIGVFLGTLLVNNITPRNTDYETMAYCLLHGPHTGDVPLSVDFFSFSKGYGLKIC